MVTVCGRPPFRQINICMPSCASPVIGFCILNPARPAVCQPQTMILRAENVAPAAVCHRTVSALKNLTVVYTLGQIADVSATMLG